jgi:hypothetical protein
LTSRTTMLLHKKKSHCTDVWKAGGSPNLRKHSYTRLLVWKWDDLKACHDGTESSSSFLVDLNSLATELKTPEDCKSTGLGTVSLHLIGPCKCVTAQNWNK